MPLLVQPVTLYREECDIMPLLAQLVASYPIQLYMHATFGSIGSYSQSPYREACDYYGTLAHQIWHIQHVHVSGRRIFQVWHILTSTKNGHMSATFGSCNCAVVRYGVSDTSFYFNWHAYSSSNFNQKWQIMGSSTCMWLLCHFWLIRYGMAHLPSLAHSNFSQKRYIMVMSIICHFWLNWQLDMMYLPTLVHSNFNQKYGYVEFIPVMGQYES